MAPPTDPYVSLGVERSATPAQIRSAYRRLARKYHPDVNPGNKGAEARFREISAAYEVLSDPEKRRAYDESAARSTTHHTEDQPASDPGDGSAARQRAGAGDLIVTVELDFASALRGIELDVPLPRQKPCPVCEGTGVQPGSKLEVCALCSGAGRTQVRAPRRGSADAGSETTVRVRIPPGTDDGSELRVRGRGVQGRDGLTVGDLLIKARVREHPHFKRDQLDLHLRLPISLEEAYAGATIEVPTPDGLVRMKIPSRTQSGARLRLRNKGVARGDKRGDLHVELDVRLPDREDERLLAALRDSSSRLYERPLREGIEI